VAAVNTAAIRLCRRKPASNNKQKCFADEMDQVGASRKSEDQALTLIHEVAHNVGWILDYKTGKYDTVQGWGAARPGRASLNADSYAWCAKDCFWSAGFPRRHREYQSSSGARRPAHD